MNYLITPRYSINKRGGKRQPSSKQPPAIIQIKENSVMSTLFTAVSVEQQEIVAGGAVVVPNISLAEAANFNGIVLSFDSQTTAGPNGAATTNIYRYTNIGANSSKRALQDFVA
ncbi:MAG: CTB family bacteriocin, partial [Dolichospermum sp.]